MTATNISESINIFAYNRLISHHRMGPSSRCIDLEESCICSSLGVAWFVYHSDMQWNKVNCLLSKLSLRRSVGCAMYLLLRPSDCQEEDAPGARSPLPFYHSGRLCKDETVSSQPKTAASKLLHHIQMSPAYFDDAVLL